MNCDRMLLSEYLDGELPGPTRRRVEAHLLACAECRNVVRQYAELGEALRAPVNPPVPADLAYRFRTRADREQPSFAARLAGLIRVPDLRQSAAFSAVGALAALALVFYSLGLASNPATRLVVVAAYPADGATEVVLDRPIEVQFEGPPGSAAPEVDVRIEPPVRVESRLEGNRLVLRPIEPLKPETKYVVKIEPKKQAPIALAPAAAPVTLNFSTGAVAAATLQPTATSPAPTIPPAPAAPAAVAAATAPSTPAETAATAARLPTRQPTALATPSPVPPVVSAAPAVAAAVPTPCERAPGKGFALLVRQDPEAAQRLGCAISDEVVREGIEQVFQGGAMVLLADRKEIHALFAGGKWASFPNDYLPGPSPTPTSATRRVPVRAFGQLWQDRLDVRGPLGTPLAAETQRRLFVQSFARGLVIGDGASTAFALYHGGVWAGNAPTVSPVVSAPVATDTPTPRATATASPTPSATSAPTPPANGTPTPTVGTTSTPSPTATTGGTIVPGTATLTPAPTASATQTPRSSVTPLIPIPSIPPIATYFPTPTATSGRPGGSATPTPLASATASPTAAATAKASPTGSSAPTATGSPSPTAAPGLTLTPTPTPSIPAPTAASGPSLTATPSASSPPATSQSARCDLPVAQRFAAAHAANPGLHARLSCAIAPERSARAVEATFDKGYVYWQMDQRQIYVLYADGKWAIHREGSAEQDFPRPTETERPSAAAASAISRVGGSAKEALARLGEPTATERTSVASIQPFERGLMIRSGDERTYVLFADGTWEMQPDEPAEEDRSG